MRFIRRKPSWSNLRTKMFKDSFEEFDDSHDVAMKVIDEYKASERKDYLEWGEKQNQSDEMNF